MFIITCTWINNQGHAMTMHQYTKSYNSAVMLGNVCLANINCSITIEEK